ncbi:hypothetical protein [Flavobacterium flavipallidum]|uniref:Uncharacterized protein n=1 Tax=Flavobacterium flavipallidum TaxID=3139140 RepID=A0ABU9HQP2_9FLAO
MKTLSKIIVVLVLSSSWFLKAQVNSAKVNLEKENTVVISSQKGINSINNSMPNRISMNITVPKQTQGTTFGEKVNSNNINVRLIENGCVVLFPLNLGYKINLKDNSINELTASERTTFGEKVNQGLHAAGGALSQGASLLGGALPGGAIVSAAVSSVGNLAGAGGGASAASYAKKTNKVYEVKNEDSDTVLKLPDGEFELFFVISQKATSGLKDTLKTQVRIGFTVENGILKTKHDTVKNSISNIR